MVLIGTGGFLIGLLSIDPYSNLHLCLYMSWVMPLGSNIRTKVEIIATILPFPLMVELLDPFGTTTPYSRGRRLRPLKKYGADEWYIRFISGEYIGSGNLSWSSVSTPLPGNNSYEASTMPAISE